MKLFVSWRKWDGKEGQYLNTCLNEQKAKDFILIGKYSAFFNQTQFSCVSSKTDAIFQNRTAFILVTGIIIFCISKFCSQMLPNLQTILQNS